MTPRDDRRAPSGARRYAFLVQPSSNRVYADAAPRLAAAELSVFATVLSAAPLDVHEERIGGVPYVAFDTELPLSTRDIAVLANLSTAFALFEVIDGDLLRPLTLAPLARYDDDLITIPKYAGKTNEHFTKLLLNVTVLASTRAAWLLDGGLTVLDPLCGRGTTLNQALMYGFDAIGIEVVGKDVDAYAAFLTTWLRRKRHKHTTDLSRVRREKRLVARRFDVSMAPSPEAHRAGDVQHLTVFHADTTRAREFLPAQAADVIVADLPYGVAHGSRTAGGLDRRPLELLRVAVPVWVELLRPGGTLGMSWNTRVARRDDAAAILTGAGLSVVDDPAYRGFEHWVDQTITRDILVARSR